MAGTVRDKLAFDAEVARFMGAGHGRQEAEEMAATYLVAKATPDQRAFEARLRGMRGPVLTAVEY